jgi:hypothetical protein
MRAEAEGKFRAAEEAATAAQAVVAHPAAWESFRAIVETQQVSGTSSGGGTSDAGAGASAEVRQSTRHAKLSFDSIRGYLESIGEVEFGATRAATDCFVPGASPTRGSPRGRDAAIAAVAAEGVSFELFVGGWESWCNAREAHRKRSARLVQDMEDRSAVRTKEMLVRRIDVLVAGLETTTTRQAAAAISSDNTQQRQQGQMQMQRHGQGAVGRIRVDYGLKQRVGAISLAAFTDGLASAGGASASSGSGRALQMDDAMMGEVERTAKKIGNDIGDGRSVPHTALADMLMDVFDGDHSTLERVEQILS